MKSKYQRGSLLLASLSALALFGAGCQQGSADETRRLQKIETSVTEIPSVVARLNALEGKEGGISEQMSSLQSSITDLEAKIAGFQDEVDSAKGTSAEAKKKADDLTAKINAASAKADALGGKIAPLEQKIALLQTRYDDHLRKYHSGG